MQVNVVGYERVQYKKKATGEDVSGYQVHYTTPIDPKRGSGVMCNTQYVSDKRVNGTVALGDAEVDWNCSRNGQAYVEMITFIG